MGKKKQAPSFIEWIIAVSTFITALAALISAFK
jgi:hypothetical protein